MNKKHFLLKERVKGFIQKTIRELYYLKQDCKATRFLNNRNPILYVRN